MTFNQILQKRRQQLYASPREFTHKAKLSCTYSYYITIEQGARLPTSALAVEIIRKLGLPLRESLMAWAAAGMPDNESRSALSEVQLQTTNEYSDFARPGAVTLSRAQVQFLLSDLLYVDVVRFHMAHLAVNGATIASAAKALSTNAKRMTLVLVSLEEYGILERVNSSRFRARNYYRFPNTPESNALQRLLDERQSGLLKQEIAGDAELRTVITRRFTESQVADIKSRILSLVASADQMPNAAEKDKTYALGGFLLQEQWAKA